MPLKILILGDVDTGKTFLSLQLARMSLEKNRKVAILCCDLGQSLVGPPATVAYKVLKKRILLRKALYLKEDRMEFIGSFSPSGFLLSFLINIKLLLEEIENKADIIIVNTTGYVKTKEAVYLKTEKIRLIRPNIIFALQRKRELEPILDKFYSYPDLKIYHFKTSPYVKRRTSKERRNYRHKILKIFFKNASLHRLKIESSSLEDKMLIGLLDKRQRTVSLGLIKKVKENSINLLTPLKKLDTIKFIKPSLIFWEGENNENQSF
jgi:polynucleotide 5'-hydroxyl-kinase GRC3/NOL9